jgi:divalent metal cation (Fe/Co/Zn/Cd) transporter
MLHRRLLALAAASIIIAALVMTLKYLAFHITGSVALFSDAAESTPLPLHYRRFG